MIDWGAFGLVLVAALVASVLVVTVFSVGIRLLSTGESIQSRSPLATAGAFACFAICVAAVLYGLYLVIPQFH